MSTETTATEHQINEWKEKAEKWDALAKRIELKYYDENGNERPEGYSDLGDIGEEAAIAFGWL